MILARRWSAWATSLVLASFACDSTAQVLADWVESDPANLSSKIALGYPVPIPVDTPTPFDGFRTYAGLHMRHQDLAATTPWVHPEQIGTTRAGRPIWAYRLGDEDTETRWGLPESASLTNGGIHAREWQTPETVTGILELMATRESDQHFYDYLRDNVNMVVIPVLNIDGFMQTQRYPSQNYLQSDPDNPNSWPRDGRMRRKNMLNVDENLSTTGDHLGGVDLNRNNPPFWDSTNERESSDNVNSLIHHGAFAQSEPEIQALDAAAQLGPASELRVYTDVHSFSLVHFWNVSDNTRLAQQTQAILGQFTNHHAAFPAGKYYAFGPRQSQPVNSGIGVTAEYFTQIYQVPSWTLEIEPSSGQAFHTPLPGAGADYGGVSENGHDGFILPESQIRRVREQLAETFAGVFYRQSGPPHVQAWRIADKASGAVIFEAEWDRVDNDNRELFTQQFQPLQLGREYDVWMAFNKPMRWLVNDEVADYPGQYSALQNIDVDLLMGDDSIEATAADVGMAMEPGGAPHGYLNYKTDALWGAFKLEDSAANQALINGPASVDLQVRAYDMTGLQLDGNPATVAHWANGFWNKYESVWGVESDFGGLDKTISIEVSDEEQLPPFLLEPGLASTWFDVNHDGEGFLLEMSPDGRAVMYWFTYDAEGKQNWYIGIGEARGNRLIFDDLLNFSGGEFGPNFDPDKVVGESVGSARFIWSGCDQGSMDWRIGNRQGRQQLARLTRLHGMHCGTPLPAQGAPVSERALLSGTWIDLSHNGEGFVVEMLSADLPMVYWFSYDTTGKPRWFFGLGEVIDGTLVFNDMMTSSGGIFGNDFDPASVDFTPWGSLELNIECNGGTAKYNSTEDGFGSGTLNLIKLTEIEGLQCP